VVAGSDAGGCGVVHGLGFLQELQQMETAGMTPMNILRAATGTSAAILAFAEPVGRIAAGCRSRMILTTHDPLATVVNLQKEKTILFDGTAIPSGTLDSDGL
jgi:imidazolonepropionase-like amidohydrolase